MQGQSGEDILGSKKMNYQFLLLVRDKKYVQALTLGRKILSLNPDNPSVEKFCKFIEKNNNEIIKMVEREKDEQQYQYDSGDSQDEEQQVEDDNEDSEKSQSEESDDVEDQNQDDNDAMDQQEAEEEQMQKPHKVQLTTCTLNSIPHICPRHHRELIQGQIQSTTQDKKTNTK